MALLHSFRVPSSELWILQCLHPLRSSQLPFRTQLETLNQRTCDSLILQFRPRTHCVLTSSTARLLEDFQRLWAAKVSTSLHALAITFSHTVSALASFLLQKVTQEKAATGWKNELCMDVGVGDANVSLAKTKDEFLRERLYGCLSEQGGLTMALLSTTAMAKDHINPIIATLCANPTFMAGLVAWTIAQVLKVFTTFFVERRWDLRMLLGSGGMPSSHSALCVALTTSVALCHGLSDALFPVCLGFSLIVMYDAIGVRRHAGMQAEVLNLIVEDLFQGHPIRQKKLKELLGHTPLQVGAGAIVGMIAGYLCSQGHTSFPGGHSL